MSPDGLDNLAQRRETARARRIAPTPRHPRPPADAEQPSDQVTPDAEPAISASGKPGLEQPSEAPISASGKAPAEQPSETVISASRKSGARARRRGRPKGPLRYTLSVRITADLDIRLTQECEASGDGPQMLVERALDEYLARQARRRARE